MQRTQFLLALFLVGHLIPRSAIAQPEPVADETPPIFTAQAPVLTPIPAEDPPTTSLVRRERSEPPRHGIYANPLGAVFGMIGLGYEHVFSDWFSLQLEGQYVNLWYSEQDAWAVGARLRPFFFLSNQAPRGVYLSPVASIAYAEAQTGGATGHGAVWSAGLLAGYAWLIGNHFTIRAGGGVEYLSLAVNV